jgi:CAAX amino protease
MVGLFGDVVTTLSGEYNYFDPALVPFMNPQEIINKFLALSPMAIAYGLLNGFYEEFFFLGLMTSVKEEHQWKALAFSTLVRFSFHTYQGMLWAIVIGVVYGLFYYFMYKKVVKNLLPFFLMHALADMFGSTFIYLLIAWAY